MLVKIKVFDKEQKEIVYFETELSIDGIINVAKSREQMVRDKGYEFAQGAIPFWGGEFLEAIAENDKKKIYETAMQVAMAAWLVDSIYGDVTEDMYRKSFLEFNVHPTGMVVFNRVSIH